MNRIEGSTNARQEKNDPITEKIARECCLLAQVAVGAREAWDDAASDLVGTGTRIGVAAACGMGLENLAGGTCYSRVLAKVGGASMAAAFMLDLADQRRLSRIASAVSDTWQSPEKLEPASRVIRQETGRFAFDTMVMSGAGFLGVGKSWLSRQRLIHQPVIPYEPPFKIRSSEAVEYSLGDGAAIVRAPERLELKLPGLNVMWNEHQWPAAQTYRSLSGNVGVNVYERGNLTGRLFIEPERRLTFKSEKLRQHSDFESNVHISEWLHEGQIQHRTIRFERSRVSMKQDGDGSVHLTRGPTEVATIKPGGSITPYNDEGWTRRGHGFTSPKIRTFEDGTQSAEFSRHLSVAISPAGEISVLTKRAVTHLKEPLISDAGLPKQPFGPKDATAG